MEVCEVTCVVRLGWVCENGSVRIGLRGGLWRNLRVGRHCTGVFGEICGSPLERTCIRGPVGERRSCGGPVEEPVKGTFCKDEGR